MNNPTNRHIKIAVTSLSKLIDIEVNATSIIDVHWSQVLWRKGLPFLSMPYFGDRSSGLFGIELKMRTDKGIGEILQVNKLLHLEMIDAALYLCNDSSKIIHVKDVPYHRIEFAS